MSTPGTLDPQSPLGADLRSLTDDEFRALKAWLLRMFGFDGNILKTIVNNPITINETGDITAMRFAEGSGGLIPTGLITPYGGGSAPTGWLLCDGSAVSRTTFATLFGLVGVTYGNGDGVTTFNVPDLRGRFPLGIDGTAGRVTTGSPDAMGGTGGGETQALTFTGDPMPDHVHQTPLLVKSGDATRLAGDTVSFGADAVGPATTVGVPSSTESVTVTRPRTSGVISPGSFIPTGSIPAVNKINPYQVVQYIIKT